MGMTPKLPAAAIDVSPEWLNAVSSVIIGIIAGVALWQSARASKASERAAASSERAAEASARSAAAAEANLDVGFSLLLVPLPTGDVHMQLKSKASRVFVHGAAVRLAVFVDRDGERRVGLAGTELRPVGTTPLPRLVHRDEPVSLTSASLRNIDTTERFAAWVNVVYSVAKEGPTEVVSIPVNVHAA